MAMLYHFFFFFLLLILARTHEQAIYNQDLHSLASFKTSADPSSSSLATWVGFNPCSGSWAGVKCNRGRGVVSINLDDAILVGNVTALLSLSHLQVLSLRRNALNGPLPHLTNLTNPRLKHLLLSHNQFSGALNMSLPYLLSLSVENNSFSGGLEGLQVPVAENFNVWGNRLTGRVYPEFSRFPVSAFAGNPALCGSPLPRCVKNTQMFSDDTPATLVAHACSSTELGGVAVSAITIGNVAVIATALIIVIGIYIWFSRKSTEVSFDRSACVPRGLVCFEGGENLRLECLLKSSAEVLGKGTAGNTYMAILDDGSMVAVKRLSNVRFPSLSKGFDRHVNLMGRLRHCNVVSLVAYCNAHEEKLLVYDYISNGSLHSLLYHKSGASLRNRGLDWNRRKQILLGAAQGLYFIHTFPAQPPLVHGNIKSSNILVNEHGNACISEWGLMVFACNTCLFSPTHSTNSLFSSRMDSAATSAWHGYRAPELVTGKERATQESDVYSFGMMLLEAVTDKEMDDEASQGETMIMVKIGMMCTRECPEERPKMNQVISMISELL